MVLGRHWQRHLTSALAVDSCLSGHLFEAALLFRVHQADASSTIVNNGKLNTNTGYSAYFGAFIAVVERSSA